MNDDREATITGFAVSPGMFGHHQPFRKKPDSNP